MKVDTNALRRSHIDGWKPRQSATIDVETLRALLDEVDELRADLASIYDDEPPACEACGKRPAPVFTLDDCHLCEPCAAEIKADEERDAEAVGS